MTETKKRSSEMEGIGSPAPFFFLSDAPFDKKRARRLQTILVLLFACSTAHSVEEIERSIRGEAVWCHGQCKSPRQRLKREEEEEKRSSFFSVLRKGRTAAAAARRQH